ncbi:MAG: hypothetical protein K0R38_5507, partial [Polyangiaceae bacterium]|nr:hypothetical protein [Polyangiaceae bacterium]
MSDSGGAGSAPVTVVEKDCEISATGDDAPDGVTSVPCKADFDALASAPLDASLPGARSAKVVLDQYDGSLYFQNSTRYKIHYDFISKNLSGGD